MIPPCDQFMTVRERVEFGGAVRERNNDKERKRDHDKK